MQRLSNINSHFDEFEKIQESQVAPVSKVVKSKSEFFEDLSMPMANDLIAPCISIARNPLLAYQMTNKGNRIAIISTSHVGSNDLSA